MSNRVKVRIFGQEFMIRSEKSEDEIYEIAEYVNQKMKDISQGFNISEMPGSLPILCALNISEEYFNQKKEIENLKLEIQKLTQDCNNYLEMWEEAKKNFAKNREEEKAQIEETVKVQKETNDQEIKELLDKCKEYENAYFDAQMEIMHLKDELKGK